MPQLLRAFIDETGDRGMKPTSSDYFAFAAVIMRDENFGRITHSLDQLVQELRKPPMLQLHWSRNVKDHADRRLAATRLGQLPVRLIYVLVPKASVRADSYLAQSTEGYYNYAARLMLERVGLFTRRRQATARHVDPAASVLCKVTFGQVKGFNPTVLRDYIAKVRRTSNDPAWRFLTPTIDVAGQGQARCLQWADIAAGAFDAAIKPNRHGMYEPAYWREIQASVDAVDGRVLRNGIKVLGDERCLTDLPWWP